jgi:hypothetical protein
MHNLRLAAIIVIPVLLNGASLAQTAIGLSATAEGTKANQELLALRRSNLKLLKSGPSLQKNASEPNRNVVVFVGDRVIPQFVDGATWQTAITVVNLENHSTSFDVLFFNDDGTDLNVPVVGQGVVRAMHISLSTAGSLTFQTTGVSSTLASGWALLSQSTNDSVGIMAIFRQSNPGFQSQEAVVPAVSQFENHFLLLFDNTQFVTGIAIANPTLNHVVIPVNIRNEQGQIIDTRQISLDAYSHTSFGLPGTWFSTVGIRGTVEFLTSGFGVGALGLRFNGSAFTSLNVLENFAWTQ